MKILLPLITDASCGSFVIFLYFATFSTTYAEINGEEIAAEEAMVSKEEAVQGGQEVTSIPQSAEILGNSTTSLLVTQNISSLEISTTSYIDIYPPHCQLYTQTGDYCKPCDDSVVLWSQTQAGGVAIEPCPQIDGIILTGYAQRVCDENGTWYRKADYSICVTELKAHIKRQKQEDHESLKEKKLAKNSTYIYLGGFILSNIAMIAAIIIFARYKHLRCLRNLIHSQLLLGITMKNFMWMGAMVGTLSNGLFERPIECKVVFAIYRFFHISQFSWMFIEGLYLFMVVVNALLTKTLRLKHCMLIGWGVPLVVIAIWTITNIFKSSASCWHAADFEEPANLVEISSISLLLVISTFFMVSVIYTLVRKLKNSALNESKQYRKAVKATMILVPLLGGTYIMMFIAPKNDYHAIWYYCNAVIQSTQGFIVALVYCFLNGEVRTSIAKSHRRWKDEQTLPAHDWWARKRRSSCAITRRDDTETETTTCQDSSRRNSRRVSEDTVSSSRRGSHIPESGDIHSNKPRRASPLTVHHKLIEKDSSSLTSSGSSTQQEDRRNDSSSHLLPNTTAGKPEVYGIA